MTPAEKILNDATRRGCRLTPVGSRLRFECPGGIDRAFEEILTRHKAALIELLTVLRCTANAVNRGDFDNLEVDATFYGVDDQTHDALCEQMQSNRLDPKCQEALNHLRALKETPKERQ